MDDKSKYWFLLTLSKSPVRGYSLLQVYENRPDFLDIPFDKFLILLEKLKEKGFIDTRVERMSSPFLFLTENGKKEIQDFYHPSAKDLKQFFELLRLTPELELRTRLENLEGFIYGIIFFSISGYILYKFPLGILLQGTFLVIFMLSLIQAGTHLIPIIYLVLEKSVPPLQEGIINFFEKSKSWLGYLIIGLVFVGGAIMMIYYLDFGVKATVGTILSGLIVYLITKVKRINNYIKTLDLRKKWGKK